MGGKVICYRVCGRNTVYYIDYSSGGVQMRGLKKLVVMLGFVIAILVFFIISLLVEAKENEKENWIDYIEIICQERNICPELVEAIIEKESNWEPKAANGDCIGLMQVSQKWHKDRMDKLGAQDLTDPYDNILVGIDYLSELFERYEDVGAVLMKWNGDSRLLEYLETGKLSEYAEKVLKRSAELERLHGK